ncbi:hypothetical protein SDC9_172053 [bioreactor metagenome]|uniref:Uncharacterized protein n=1 Tax=bioreactor metagenome TaxID=1076179 RepID=A0A645GCL3_9ZZZZ
MDSVRPVGGDHGPRRPHQGQAPRADHVHHRPVAAFRSGLREDRPPLHGEPEGFRTRLRQSLVQADPPRPRPAYPLPRGRCAEGSPDLARPDSSGRSQADRRQGRRSAEIPDSRLRSCQYRAHPHRLGFGRDLPRYRHARRGERRTSPPRAAERLGRQRPERTGERAGQAGKRPT